MSCIGLMCTDHIDTVFVTSGWVGILGGGKGVFVDVCMHACYLLSVVGVYVVQV